MNSLKEVYGTMLQRDHEKVAQVRAAQGLPPQVDMSQVDPALLKQAQDYDHIGRIMAHSVFTDIIKQAVDEAGTPPEKKDDEVAKLLAQARGESTGSEKKDGEGGGDDKPKDEDGEKKEAAKKILARMAKDPKYTSKMIAKHSGKIAR